MIIQFFMNENVYIRILCHSQNIFSLSRVISLDFWLVFLSLTRFHSLQFTFPLRIHLIFNQFFTIYLRKGGFFIYFLLFCNQCYTTTLSSYVANAPFSTEYSLKMI